MNAGDRAHWLDPSPPIAVDGEEPDAPKRRPAVLRPDEVRDDEAAAPDGQPADAEDLQTS